MKYPKKDQNKDDFTVSDFQENYDSGARFRLFWDSVIDHPYVGFSRPYDKTLAWFWMIFEARRKEQKGKEIQGKCIDIPPSSFIHSLRFMAKAFGWTEKKVRTFLNHLENLKMIERKLTQGLTQITICNFEDYQNPRRTLGRTEGESKAQTPTGKQVNTSFVETSWQYRFAKRFWERKQDDYGHYTYIQKAKENDFQTWADELDKLNRIDKKDKETIGAVLKFALEDDFWKSNLLALTALRKPNDNGIPKFEVIESKMKRFSENGKDKNEESTTYEYWN